MRKSNMYLIGVTEGENDNSEREVKCSKIMAGSFPGLKKFSNFQVEKVSSGQDD